MTPQPQRSLGRVGRRLVVGLLAAAILGGAAGTASAKPHVACLISADSATATNKGVCLVLPLPDPPTP